MKLKFDWKDGLLLCAGFLAGIAVLVALKEAFGVSADDGLVELVGLVTVAGPVGLRRLIFGAPVLPEPRSGVFASLLSIVGLLATIAGLLVFAGGAVGLLRAFRAPPDFASEARQAQADSNAAVEALLGAAAQPLGAAVASAPDPEDAARQAEELQATVAERRAEWEASRSTGMQRSLAATAVGLLLVALGALATRGRDRPA